MVRILAISALLLSAVALAHGGRTDSNGCHNDRKNGGYHCHGGTTAPPVRASTPAPTRTAATPAKPPEDALPVVPADARPVKAPVDKAVAKPPAPAPPVPAPELTPKAAAKPQGDATIGFVCLAFMAAGVVWLGYVIRKAFRKRAGRQEIQALPEAETSERAGPHEILRREKKTKRMFEKEMRAYRYSDCSVCTIRIRPDDRIFWDPYDKQARHAGYCEQLVSEANATAAQKAERKEQVSRSEAFHRLLERLMRAKTAATREKVVAEAKEEQTLTAQQRLRLLLEASKADTDDTLEKVEALKSKAVKRRRLEEMLNLIRADEVPDDLQTDQIALLEEALRTLDAEA